MVPEWRNKVELTITVVRNDRFAEAENLKQVLEALRDYDNVAPKYQENTLMKVEDAFNTHEGRFYALARRLADNKFIIVENNGYFGGTPGSVTELSRPTEATAEDQKNNDAAAAAAADSTPEEKLGSDAPYVVGYFWNVNMDNSFNVAVAGKVLWLEEPYGEFEPDFEATHWIFGAEKKAKLQELFGSDDSGVESGLQAITELTGVTFADDWLEGDWEVACWDAEPKKADGEKLLLGCAKREDE